MSSAARGRHGLFSFFLFCFLSLPCAVLDWWRMWPLLAIWIAGCGVRWYREDRLVATDCFIFALSASWLLRKELLEFAFKRWGNAYDIVGSSTFLASGIIAGLALTGIPSRLAKGSKNNSSIPIPENACKWDLPYPKPKIFPCQTQHARMFPKRHAFTYSYLQCGYPIIPVATMPTGEGISDCRDQELGRWWLRVRAVDYLERGYGEAGFYNKLKKYLRARHVKDNEWSYAYLVTAPRFFGYSFNPVSFWYIYDDEHQLKKMILEVNNTFGERRMYLLDGLSSPSPPRTPGSQASTLSEESARDLPDKIKSKFSDIWMKDFHVSPFNSRKGSYALKALNPFPHATYDNPKIDNTITLKSSKDYAKLVARLNSTKKALDPDQLGLIGTVHFILSWWWVGLVTFPRILREAFKLFYKKNLNVWFRPEVLSTSIGRLPTSSEIALHQVFRDYLFQIVHETEDPFCITLKTSIPAKPTDMVLTTHQPGRERPVRCLEMRILTPAFYSRMVHYTSLEEAIDRECVFTDEKNRTLWLCRPQLLSLLLPDRTPSSTDQYGPTTTRRGFLDEIRWVFLRKLRCPPADPAYSVTPKSSTVNIGDIRSRPYSEMDSYVRRSSSPAAASEYRRSVSKLFLAQRYCFGFVEIISLLDLCVRVILCLVGAAQLRSSIVRSSGSGLVECINALVTQKGWTACFGEAEAIQWESWGSFLSGAALVFACHAYELSKGYR